MVLSTEDEMELIDMGQKTEGPQGDFIHISRPIFDADITINL